MRLLSFFLSFFLSFQVFSQTDLAKCKVYKPLDIVQWNSAFMVKVQCSHKLQIYDFYYPVKNFIPDDFSVEINSAEATCTDFKILKKSELGDMFETKRITGGCKSVSMRYLNQNPNDPSSGGTEPK